MNRPFIAAAMSAAFLATSSAASAHGNHIRGQIINESVTVKPVPGYTPPDPATLGGAFELMDHTGATITDKSYPGRTMLIYFGYAGCREACPIALDSLSRALELLGGDAAKVQPLFVDIDMAGPDLKGLSQFVGNFHPSLIGLTGSRKQMYHMLRLFKVRREYGNAALGKKETGPRIDHTTYVFLVKAGGKVRKYFYHNLTPERMRDLIRKEL